MTKAAETNKRPKAESAWPRKIGRNLLWRAMLSRRTGQFMRPQRRCFARVWAERYLGSSKRTRIICSMPSLP